MKAERERGRLLYRVVRTLIQVVCRVYWRATFEGLENVPRSGAFVVAPVHRSFLDFGIVSGISRRRLGYMGKDSLWNNRLLGAFISALGAFPVRRGAADRDALRQCIEVIQAGRPVVLFPEGTRRNGPVIEHLFEGTAYVAGRTGVPIVPVGIGGSERALPKGQKLPRPVKIHVVVGKPMDPPPARDDGRPPRRSAVHEVTDNLHQELQRLFDQAQRAAGVEQ